MPSRSSASCERRFDRVRRRGAELAPVEVAHDLAADADAVELVGGEVVGEPGDVGVHARAAELLVARLLARRHLHERRPAEEHLGAFVDHHRVVAHPGYVRAAGGRVAEHERDRRDLHRRELDEVAEDLARVDEEVGLGGQVGAARLHQLDQRHPVDLGDLQRPQVLLQRPRVHRPAAHRGVVGDDHALDARHHADAGDDDRPHVELGAPRRERGELEERRVAVDEQLDALAGEQLAAGAVAGLVALAAARDRERDLLVVLGDELEQRRAVGLIGLARRIDRGAEDGHRYLRRTCDSWPECRDVIRGSHPRSRRSEDARLHAGVRMIAPAPVAHSTCSAPLIWLAAVPRIWRVPSSTLFTPWM